MTYLILFTIALLGSMLLAYEGVRKTPDQLRYNKFVVASFTLMFIFIGFRVNVGIDYINYLNSFKYISKYDFGAGTQHQIEYGYLALLSILRSLGFDGHAQFPIFALLTLIPFFNLFKNNPRLLPFGIFIFYVCLPYDFIINGVRQGVSIFAVLCALNHLDGIPKSFKDIIHYILWIVYGSLFHTTCVAFLIVPLLMKFIPINRLVLLAIAISGFVINLIGLTELLIPTDLAMFGEQYSTMAENLADYNEISTLVIRPIVIVQLIFYLIPIFYSDFILEKYPNLRYFFLFMAIGMFLNYLAPTNLFLRRISYYFLFSEVLVYPALIQYVKTLKYNPKIHKSEKVIRLMKYYIILWCCVNFIFSLKGFSDLQLWPNASLFGIPIN